KRNGLFKPSEAKRTNSLEGDATRGKQNRISWGEVIILPVHDDEFGQCDQVSESDDAITPAFAGSDQPDQSAEPQRKSCRIHQGDLLREKFPRHEDDVLVALRDSMQQNPGGPTAFDLPADVRERDDKCDQTGEPNPFPRKLTTFRR